MIDSDLQTAWTATAQQPGLASAYDVADLVSAVESARKMSDTVVVYLHWGTETDDCPNDLQEPLARDARGGRCRHRPWNPRPRAARRRLPRVSLCRLRTWELAFYDNSPPENQSGSLVVTVTGGTSTA